MKKILLVNLFCVALIIIAGCTSPIKTEPAVVTATGTGTVPPISVAPTTMVPELTTLPITTSPTVNITPNSTTPPSDPIEHRYIRQYIDPKTAKTIGYEYKFFHGGILRYRSGTTTMSSGNIVIDEMQEEGSGTWTNLGNNKYLLKYLPTAVSGADVIKEYTLVAAHVDPSYPGIVIVEHIESDFETSHINKGEQIRHDYMYFPERAKID